MPPLVTVVVVNWNLSEETIACVRSLMASDYPGCSIVVVDNGSREGCVARIRAALPAIQMLTTGENLGYAGGNNVGIRHALDAGADYVLLLNNDTLVDEGCITALIRAAEEDPGLGLLGPAIYYHSPEADCFWRLGAVHKPWLPVPLEIGRDEKDVGQYPTPFEVDYLTGCAMLVRSSLFGDIGLLDTGYFMYYEDADFCQRARNHAYRAAVVPNARLWHKVSQSSREQRPVAAYYRTRNRILFYNRYWRGYRRLMVNGYIVSSILAEMLRRWRDREFVVYSARGLRDGYARVTGKVSNGLD
jgi:GT2 family glycosyltransferase